MTNSADITHLRREARELRRWAETELRLAKERRDSAWSNIAKAERFDRIADQLESAH